MTTEKMYLQDGDVTITSARAIISGTTYTMAHVTSVKAVAIKKKYTIPIILILSGMLFFLVGLGGDSAGMCVTVGVILLLVGIVIAVTNKSKYVVRIGSSSGEADALTSTNQGQIQKIVNALQRAIVDRG